MNPEYIRAAHIVDHWFLCKRDVVKRAKRYRKYRNQVRYMGKRYVIESGEPVAKRQKIKGKKKKYKGDAVHQRLVAVGGVGTRYREKKNIDTTPTITFTTGVRTWLAPILLNGVAVGDDGVSRDGRKVLFKKILVRALYGAGATTVNGCVLRFAIVYDKQANGGTPAITDIFTEDDFLTTNNLGNVERFVILKDWITPCLTVDGPETIANVKSIATQMETIYSGTTSANTSIASGSIWLLCCSAGRETTAPPIAQMRIRLRFVDV